jgi:uncharacterized protein YgiM (DUF1202 family)
MKRYSAFLFLYLFSFASLSWAEPVMVLTKQNALREGPKFFAPVKIQVKYSDMLDVIGQEGDWYRVRFKNVVGYIHRTAIEKKTISLKETAGTQKHAPSDAEVALAGKGFNSQVEKAYQNKHPEMKYSLVNKVETYTATDNEVRDFIKKGGLQEP